MKVSCAKCCIKWPILCSKHKAAEDQRINEMPGENRQNKQSKGSMQRSTHTTNIPIIEENKKTQEDVKEAKEPQKYDTEKQMKFMHAWIDTMLTLASSETKQFDSLKHEDWHMLTRSKYAKTFDLFMLSTAAFGEIAIGEILHSKYKNIFSNNLLNDIRTGLTNHFTNSQTRLACKYLYLKESLKSIGDEDHQRIVHLIDTDIIQAGEFIEKKLLN